MARTIQVITPRTDAEWPADHPLRKVARVVASVVSDRADFLICTIVGEDRTPPAEGDHDVSGSCFRCGMGIVWRASAPSVPKRICWRCWEALNP